jgi:Rrf2 family protein
MINTTSLQTIKALVELAKLESGRCEGIARIAQRIHAPQNYLAKTVQGLVSEGLVISQKGLNGGFRLAQKPSEINLYQIVDAVEGLSSWEGCFLGNETCSRKTACLVHDRWGKARAVYTDFLKKTTLADLISK